jgi:hypothetical protein
MKRVSNHWIDGVLLEWSNIHRVSDGCLPIGVVWSIDLLFTAFTDTMLAPFAWIPAGRETPDETAPHVTPDNPEESGGR